MFTMLIMLTTPCPTTLFTRNTLFIESVYLIAFLLSLCTPDITTRNIRTSGVDLNSAKLPQRLKNICELLIFVKNLELSSKAIRRQSMQFGTRYVLYMYIQCMYNYAHHILAPGTVNLFTVHIY